MHLQCLPIEKEKYRCTGYIDDPLLNIVNNAIWICLLALYGSTMHAGRLCGGLRTIFFLLSVWSPCYTLSRKKNNSWGN